MSFQAKIDELRFNNKKVSYVYEDQNNVIFDFVCLFVVWKNCF